jgi:hypothetical protein
MRVSVINLCTQGSYKSIIDSAQVVLGAELSLCRPTLWAVNVGLWNGMAILISDMLVHVWAARMLHNSSASVYSHQFDSNYSEDNMGKNIFQF